MSADPVQACGVDEARRISVVESSVRGLYDDGRRELQFKATVTLAVVEAEGI